MVAGQKLNGRTSGSIKSWEFRFYLAGIENNNVATDFRPQVVEIPNSQEGTLAFVLEDQLFTVPVGLTYTLNPNYNPTRSQDCDEAYLAELTRISQGAGSRAPVVATHEASTPTPGDSIEAGPSAKGRLTMIAALLTALTALVVLSKIRRVPSGRRPE